MTAAALLAGALLLAPPAAVEQASEADVKAAFLYNFARFVEWPADARPPGFTVAVLGSGPLADAVAALHGKAIGEQRLVVVRVERPDEARDAQILLVTREAPVEPPALAAALRGRSVLTVGDRPGFAARGGIINFVLRDQRVRFEVNLREAQAERLRISSQLLKLATLVEEPAP